MWQGYENYGNTISICRIWKILIKRQDDFQ